MDENEIQKKLIMVVKNQTTYTEEEIIEKLKENSNDPIQVIRDYMNIKPKEKEEKKSLNQTVYSEIGAFLKQKK
tara:strand:+ start:491 stop:712 length:222 start_codon:yes stop_codon:yes gene_type:complete